MCSMVDEVCVREEGIALVGELGLFKSDSSIRLLLAFRELKT